ncbi:hypothetical protein [Actinophytocola sp.]|uniref:hypothetical protein n=1 Tax=Actinophytocola sp. TaxID=1872138 RepID=UPI00389A3403
MAENFYLDEPAFEGVTDDLLVTGTNFKTAHTKLNGVLTAYQGCWGDDEIGMAFQNNYWENAEKVREGTENGGEGLIETARTSRKSAEYLSSVDEQTAQYLDSQVHPE